MAQKALLHRIRIKNGHGESEYTYAAQRGEYLKFLENNNCKIVSIKSLGWHEVVVHAGSTEITFRIEGLNLSVGPDDIGYGYLENQFRPIVDAASEGL
jgi:hypothetical protein